MNKTNNRPMIRWRIDCATLGVQETWAVSSSKARSNVIWRFRQRGIYPITAFWGEPVAVDLTKEVKNNKELNDEKR